ncbi:hypothetical protein OIDMADRAFT_26597 [Oidiodendron maius Zn]|uniref:BTB domain-containing protein n=1 Tax=Oidiodendron maius (strain Zn) TaxID=913774 RepID=A0A0C3CY61_OIDMZ|nr:hypothetical protein OIDMADRAFT_26597 [Oidiodendron maius Zn]
MPQKVSKSGGANKSRTSAEKSTEMRRVNFTTPTAMVTLVVGSSDNPVKFTLHKDFACHYSPVFHAAFNGNFIEGQTQTYHLEDAQDKVVTLLVQWIYTRRIVTTDNYTDYENLITLWILADKLCMPALQNAIIDRLFKTKPKPDCRMAIIGSLEKIYNETAGGCQLQKFAVDVCATYLKPDDIRETLQLFPAEFLIDYASRFYRPHILVPWEFDASDYHVSTEDKSKSSSAKRTVE